jgi:prevent-host-death family protein
VHSFQLDEIVAARDAARGFSGLLERLRSGGAQRYVIFFRNRPQAVLLHVSEYERLVEQAGEGAGAPAAAAALAST